MTAPLSLVNITSFGIQVAVIVAAGVLLIRAFRIDAPAAVLAYWRTLLVACVLLPLCQPWTIIDVPVTTMATTTASSLSLAADVIASTTPAAPSWRPGDRLLLLLAAGIAARVLWLTLGAYGLRRLRRRSVPVDPLPDSLSRACDRVGARAAFSVSDQISGPITFGVIRPVIVLPPGIFRMPAHVQEAIACHELLHVQRRDWLYEILEEAVLTVLWFHPAIWVLIGRIRLAREQVVDEATIRLTESREHYVESLLAVARARLLPSFSLASPFLRRHLLKKRVARILQEHTMTTRRLIVSLTASGAALALAATFAVRSFPLEAQAPARPASDEPIQVVAGGEHLLHGERPEYPRRAIEQKVEGDVQVEMTLNDRGEVSDARVLSGPEELRKAALESVLQWHYSPAALASTVTHATLRFHVPAGGFFKEEPKEGFAFAVTEHSKRQLLEHRLEEIAKAIEDPATPDSQRVELKMKAERARAELEHTNVYEGELVEVRTKLLERQEGARSEGPLPLVRIATERVSAETVKEVLQHAGIAIGDAITPEITKRIGTVAAEIDEHLRVEYRKAEGGIVLMILAR